MGAPPAVQWAAGEGVPEAYLTLVKPHVESFDWFVGEGMRMVFEALKPVSVKHPLTGRTHSLWLENPSLQKPLRENTSALDPRMYPWEARESGSTYRGAFHCDLVIQADGDMPVRHTKRLGYLPIMVRSSMCHLRSMNRTELVRHNEETNDMGGYFVCNGIERVVRMLIATRRHYVLALNRGAYQKRGPLYTSTATLLRCVKPNMESQTVRCHYLTDGCVNFAITVRKAEYFIPAGLLLKCFVETTDREIYERLVSGAPGAEDESGDGGGGHAAFVAERAELLLRQASRLGVRTRAQCLGYLGRHFRSEIGVPEEATDVEAGLELLKSHVFIHLGEDNGEKMQLLVFMLQKLYALANGQCSEDNPDALIHHEILLPGHLLAKYLKEKLEDVLIAAQLFVRRLCESAPESVDLSNEAFVRKMMERLPDVGKRFEYLLNTGNMVSRSGLDLQQTTGFTIVAEKLNFFRYMSHFRSVHRGAYFAQIRTTTVRKLLPESWGFMCPVHTPDGAPCGLLTHLTATCTVDSIGPHDPAAARDAVTKVLLSLGMLPVEPELSQPPLPAYLTVMVDGRVVGSLASADAPAVVARLRLLKAYAWAASRGSDLTQAADAGLTPAERLVPPGTEAALVPYEQGGPFPGLFVFTEPARMLRPVVQAGSGMVELVGTLEQAYLDIACPDGGHNGSPGLKFTHREVAPSSMLSVVASLTPFSDYNQSPRNMYQCQMGKQTMGTPCHAIQHRVETKTYRLQTPQTPLCRTERYRNYHMDEYPNGTNAIVAVLAYTGYDMEDAMILNKSSVERGAFHASMYKTETVDLRQDSKTSRFMADRSGGKRKEKETPRTHAFGQEYPRNVPSVASSAAVSKRGVVPGGQHVGAEVIDRDGLPHIGAVVWPAAEYASSRDTASGRTRTWKLKGEEIAVVDSVAVVGPASGSGGQGVQQANITLRYNRNPVIGDKFASRAGQKGVLSQLWPDVDMPYCVATGIRPDLIINPNAFPSRMTIGMLIESMASKAGALNGEFVDASPFQPSIRGPDYDPITEVGERLEAKGFYKWGGETMVSGITGEEFQVDIYIGIVYYQRLRHMVSDKFQVRSTGPINPLTRQPIKGRKLGGGIRLGEMERDALLAHGAAYVLHDRLHTCSDYSTLDACASCGSILSPAHVPSEIAKSAPGLHVAHPEIRGTLTCTVCQNTAGVCRVAIPYVFKFLATELAAMNIRMKLDIRG